MNWSRNRKIKVDGIKIIWNSTGIRIEMEMGRKFMEKENIYNIEWKLNGNEMVVLSEIKFTPDGTEMEWKRHRFPQ